MVVAPATLRYARRVMGGKGDRPAGLENRWWVDQQKDAQGHLIDRPRVPLRFFRSGAGSPT